jgi:hypothetical protein
MRLQRKTIFFCGEGKSDKVFIDHLVNCFKDGQIVSAKPTVAAGGSSPEIIINKALQSVNNTLYDYKIIVMDNDSPIPRYLYQEAIDAGFMFLLPPFKNTELEAWLHLIKDKKYVLSGGYKREFYSKYKTEKTDVLTQSDCFRVFPKADLRSCTHCDRLQALIHLLNTGEWLGYVDERNKDHPNLS